MGFQKSPGQHTIDGFALRKIVVILASQEAIAITSDDTLNVASKTLGSELAGDDRASYPLLTL